MHLCLPVIDQNNQVEKVDESKTLVRMLGRTDTGCGNHPCWYAGGDACAAGVTAWRFARQYIAGSVDFQCFWNQSFLTI